MPSHNHNYSRFHYSTYYYPPDHRGKNYYPCKEDSNSNFYESYTTNYTGGSNPHNNMPPYITAYCWMRVS